MRPSAMARLALFALLSACGGAQRPGPEAPPAPTVARAPAAPPSVHLMLGTPTDADPSDDELLVKDEYALSYNGKRRGPNWVSWQLDASWLGPVRRRKGRFLADDTLPVSFARVTHGDYTDSGYERGHMVPSEDRTRSPEANKATFYLTNVLPQRHDLNIGPWLRLEETCHRLAAREGRQMFLVAGGIYPVRPEVIGAGVSVPEAFFKIVVVLDPGQGAGDVRESTRVIAVIMPNAEGIHGARWATYRTTVREIERRTGYDFLDRVPAPVQRLIEERVDAGPER